MLSASSLARREGASRATPGPGAGAPSRRQTCRYRDRQPGTPRTCSGVSRPAHRPSQGLHGAAIALAGRAEDRQPRRIADQLTAVRGHAAAQQHHRPDLRVASSELHRLIHAAARTCRADARLVDALLGRQPRIGGVDVSGPFPVGDPLLLLGIIRLRPAALSVAAIVQGDDVEAARGRRRRQVIPRRPIAIAGMQQEKAGPRASRGEVGRLQRDPVRRLQIDRTRRGRCRRRRRLRLRTERRSHRHRHEDGTRNRKCTAVAAHGTSLRDLPAA